MTSPMSAINTDTSERSAKIGRIQKLARTLGKITEVPKVLADAVEFSTFRYETGSRSKAARTLLSQAKTEADMSAALDELAEALVVEHQASDSMRTVRIAAQFDRLMDALHDVERDVFQVLAEKFNEVAPDFDKAARDLPDLGNGTSTVTSAFSFTRKQTDALHDSARAAEALNTYYLPYQALAALVSSTGVKDATLTAYLLGKVDNDGTALNVANTLTTLATGIFGQSINSDASLALKPVMPFYAFTLNGVSLELCAHPEDADDNRQTAMAHLLDQMR